VTAVVGEDRPKQPPKVTTRAKRQRAIKMALILKIFILSGHHVDHGILPVNVNNLLRHVR
jgi:hypothetical protein